MKLSIQMLAVCLCLILVISCKKRSNDDYQKLSPVGKLLVDGKWQEYARIATTNYMGKDTTLDMFSTLVACEKDDFILYHANTSGTVDENANKCTWDGQVEGFGWALLEGDTKLALIDSNPDTFHLDITSAEYKIKITKSNSSGVPVTYVYSFRNIK